MHDSRLPINGTQKFILIVTLFTLTAKLQHLIIFLDEIRKPMKPKIYLNYIQEISLNYRVKFHHHYKDQSVNVA